MHWFGMGTISRATAGQATRHAPEIQMRRIGWNLDRSILPFRGRRRVYSGELRNFIEPFHTGRIIRSRACALRWIKKFNSDLTDNVYYGKYQAQALQPH